MDSLCSDIVGQNPLQGHYTSRCLLTEPRCNLLSMTLGKPLGDWKLDSIAGAKNDGQLVWTLMEYASACLHQHTSQARAFTDSSSPRLPSAPFNLLLSLDNVTEERGRCPVGRWL